MFALSNSPFKAKLVSMQGNAANILTIQNTIDGGGQGGYGGNYISILEKPDGDERLIINSITDEFTYKK